MKTNELPAPLNVLVVDDDEDIRLILQSAITKQGHQVTTAKNAEEALSSLQRRYFHVVITDIQMGEMSGVELMQEIKDLNALSQIYIVTAHSHLEVVIQCMKGGAADYFEKPLDIKEVLASLQEASRRVARWSTLYKKYMLKTQPPA